MVADFEKRTATSVERQRVRWSWSTDGKWTIPSRPRFAFLREPELFKLYIVTGLPTDDRVDQDSPAVKSFVSTAFEQYSGQLSSAR
jgi:hypothetical protein